MNRKNALSRGKTVFLFCKKSKKQKQPNKQKQKTKKNKKKNKKKKKNKDGLGPNEVALWATSPDP